MATGVGVPPPSIFAITHIRDPGGPGYRHNGTPRRGQKIDFFRKAPGSEVPNDPQIIPRHVNSDYMTFGGPWPIFPTCPALKSLKTSQIYTLPPPLGPPFGGSKFYIVGIAKKFPLDFEKSLYLEKYFELGQKKVRKMIPRHSWFWGIWAKFKNRKYFLKKKVDTPRT